MKNTNMPIKKIKEYVDLCSKGDDSLNERYELIKEQKENILKQIDEYKKYLKEIEFKEWYYETVIKNGTEKGMDEIVCNKATLEIDKIPKNISKENNVHIENNQRKPIPNKQKNN